MPPKHEAPTVRTGDKMGTMHGRRLTPRTNPLANHQNDLLSRKPMTTTWIAGMRRKKTQQSQVNQQIRMSLKEIEEEEQ